MPAWNEDRTVCILFTGEEFDVCDDLHGLKTRGHSDVRPDARALVHCYEEEGPRIFAKLNGWYSGVVVDVRADTVTLFNDRFGLNRLYYHESENGFYFASEAKSILTVLPH